MPAALCYVIQSVSNQYEIIQIIYVISSLLTNYELLFNGRSYTLFIQYAFILVSLTFADHLCVTI